MVIDGHYVITGSFSFNFIKAAESKNAENLLIMDSQALAGIYRKNWEAHLKHSESANQTESKTYTHKDALIRCLQ